MSSSEKETKKGKSLKPSRKVAVTIAVLVAIAATVFASILSASSQVRDSVNAASCDVFHVLFGMKAEDNTAALDTAVNAFTTPALIVLSCAISYALVFYILRVCKTKKRTAAILALAPVIAPVTLSFISGGFGMASWLIMAAAVLCVAALLLYDFLKEKYPKIFKSMAVSYIFFGALTTAVSFITKMIFYSYNWWTFFVVALSWIITVLFAYVVNKLFVFKTDTDNKEELMKEAGLFFAMRLISWGIEFLFLWITVDLVGWAEAPCVLAVQVVILVSNYFFSKMKVFVKRKDAKPAEDAKAESPKLLNETNDKKD